MRAPGNIPNNLHYDSLWWCQSFVAHSHSLRTSETNDARARLCFVTHRQRSHAAVVMHEVSPNFANTHADASREDEVISLASIHQQLSKLTASNDIISAEVAELKRSTSYSGNHRSRCVSRADTTSGRRSKMYRGPNAEGLCWYHLV